ncbi:hypothetical protein PR002_g29960 [Phytophthora rubi]|uniref:Chromo domain-containing protein n=1 Tax=Phytophthora rubi TaxID=129364 RepID=A0A6A3GWH4_9STRA|nr:hypothetical protein PR002_g29960 [Phytophthora rubi]
MSSSLKRGSGRQSDALAWRREVNRQQEIALSMAKEYQATEKARRAKEHNETLGRQERESLQSPSGEVDPNETPPRSLFEPGSRVWLYMERVKPGLTKKLAHRWHGPFRIKKKVEEFAYELELPNRSGYRFYPVVRLAPEVDEESRVDFDKELLPEDSWEPDRPSGEFEVEAILDDRTPLSTSTNRALREFKVKWVGYEEPTWELAANLSCGGLLYDYLRQKRSDRRLHMAQTADEG